MSLTPLLFSNWWEDLESPHHLLDQHFGLPLDLDDVVRSIAPSRSEIVLFKPSRSHSKLHRYHPFLENLARRSNKRNSSALEDKEKFCVTLDVHQFHPEEVNIKVVDNTIVVDAKHEEKEDEHGFVSRQFTRKYSLPDQYDIDQVESRLSSDGVLIVTAPKKQPQKLESNERVIKIRYTGTPALSQPEASTSSPSKEQNQQRQAVQRGKKPTVKAA